MMFSNDELAKVVAAWHRTPNSDAIAVELGVNPLTAWRMLRHASQLGLIGGTVPPGFNVTQLTDTPNGTFTQTRPEPEKTWEPEPGMFMKGLTSYVREGKVVGEWKMQRHDEQAAFEGLLKYLKGTFDEVQTPHLPVLAPTRVEADKVNLFPCNDWHINMLAWEREVGENWDVKIAEQRIGDAMCTVIARAGYAGLGIVLGGGDLMHNDNNDNRTRKSGAVLDCDTRHAKGREAAVRMMVRVIDEALCYNTRVMVRLLKGNHDESTTAAISYYLSAWYRHEPRVEVDLDESLFWCYRHGKTMLAATHGHTIKMGQMPEVMAGYWPHIWGETDHHFGHFFHIHHKDKILSEHGHCVVESHRAPIPKDGWHFASGYLSGRDVQAITYHDMDGETGRVIEVVRGVK